MTLPRPVKAGDTVITQKRCHCGEFRLRPDPEVVQTYWYVLGYCEGKYKVELHEFVGMSNHDHPLLTDPQQTRVKFIQLLHSLVARALNSFFGEWDSLWSGQPHSAVKLIDTDDVLTRLIYVLLNPVAAGLVRYAWDWEGVTSWHMEYGVPVKVKKPSFFFTDDMPDEVEVTIHRPKGLFPGLSDRAARAKVRELAKAKQADLIAKAREEGRTFMGMKRVLRQPRHTRPSTHLERRGIRPNVACRSKWARIEALGCLKQFRADHEAARLAFKAGDRNVEFPAGTYLMKVRHNVRVRPPP